MILVLGLWVNLPSLLRTHNLKSCSTLTISTFQLCIWMLLRQDHKVHFHLPVVDAPDPRGLVDQTIRTTCIDKTTAYEHGDYDPIHHNLQKCTWSLSYCRSLTRPTSINCWTGSTFRHCWQLVLTRSSTEFEYQLRGSVMFLEQVKHRGKDQALIKGEGGVTMR